MTLFTHAKDPRGNYIAQVYTAMCPHTDNKYFLIKCKCISNTLSGLNHTTNTSKSAARHQSTGKRHLFTPRYVQTTYTPVSYHICLTHRYRTQQRPAKLATPAPNTRDTGAQGDEPESTSTHTPRSFSRLNITGICRTFSCSGIGVLHPLLRRDYTYFVYLYTIHYLFNSVGFIFVSPNLLHHPLPSYDFV
jgi:hypothetical protein